MTKRELIDEITMRNATAKPEFLSRFEEADLGAYLDHLIVARRPRLSGGGNRYAKYFLPPQERIEPVRMTQPALFVPVEETVPAEETTSAPAASEPEPEPQVQAAPVADELEAMVGLGDFHAHDVAPVQERASQAIEEESPAAAAQEDEIENRPVEVYSEPIEYVPVEDSIIDPLENESAEPVERDPVENTVQEIAEEIPTEAAPEVVAEQPVPAELVRAKPARVKRTRKEKPAEQEWETAKTARLPPSRSRKP